MANNLGISCAYFDDFLLVIGCLATLYITIKCIISLYDGISSYFLAKTLGLSKDLKKCGQWAVVTGATDGIGKAYAQELAKKGLDVCLVSRNPEKLADVAAEIEGSCSVKTKCVSVDFTGGAEIYDKIRAELSGMDIGVLVNNVGMAYMYPEFYADLDDETVRRLINMNINSVAQMSHIVLPGMAERKRGVIVNISSASALKPTPLLTLYSATKAFVDTFSQALNMEYQSKGIIVQCVMPFFVATKLSKIRRTSFFIPGPVAYVKQAVGTIGLQLRTFGCVSHALQAFVVSRLPDFITNHVALKQMLAVRKKALARQHKTQ